MDTTKSPLNEWSTDFGKDYTDRNPQNLADLNALCTKKYGVTRSSTLQKFVSDLDRGAKILEVGCNTGTQLECFQSLGFSKLHGVEPLLYALEIAKSKKGISVVPGSAFDLPFRDGYFDLVFTAGVLIHIEPAMLGRAMDEIHRGSARYIMGTEYFWENHQEVPYRGKAAMLWKANFAKMYLDRFPDLTLVKEERLKYLDSDNVDSVFLLEKRK